MSVEFPRRAPKPPLGRTPEPLSESDLEWTFVACACGVDMRLRWPRFEADVRCFGCGNRFPRPPHLPQAPALPPWPEGGVLARRRAEPALSWRGALLLALAALAVGVAIGRLVSV